MGKWKKDWERVCQDRAALLAENARLRRESRRLLCLLSGHSPDDPDYEPPVAAIRWNPACRVEEGR